MDAGDGPLERPPGAHPGRVGGDGDADVQAATALHCHGMDCCWDCFHGTPRHPESDDGFACQGRSGDDGRCLYA